MILKISIAFAVALLLSVFLYRYKRPFKGKWAYLLLGLRFLSLFLLGLIFINPSIKKIEAEVVKPKLLVAVDNSKSISFLNENQNVKKLITQLKNNEDIRQKFEVSFFTFGDEPMPLDSLSFSEQKTDISALLQQLEKIYGSENNPVVLITDGNQTQGNDIAYLSYKNPVFPIVVGDTTSVSDVYIHQLNANKYAYLGNRFPIEFFVNYEGNEDVLVTVNVAQKGKYLFQEKITLSKENNTKHVTTYLKANKKGQQYYNVSVSTIKNEKNTQNNTSSFTVKVIDENFKVLLLTSVTHPDVGMLKRAIESSQKIKVVVKNREDKVKDISKYKLVILYQPTSDFQSTFNEVIKAKTNYFIVTGLHTDWHFLNKIQPYFSKKMSSQTEMYFPVFNENYTSFLTEDIGFSNFSPLADVFGEIELKNEVKTLLSSKVRNINLSQPLLATFENNSQKVVVLFGENSWRWRMKSFVAEKSFVKFDKLMSNLIQYASSSQKTKQLEISVNPLYYANEDIVFTAFYSDKNYQFDSRAKLWLQINGVNGFSKKVPFALEGNSYKALVNDIEKGDYNYKVSVESSDAKAAGIFKILPFDIEEKFVTAQDKKLQKLAQNTKGELSYIGQEKLLIDFLANSDRFKSTMQQKIEKQPLIHWKWLLGLLLLLLSFEWFIRKYLGMI